MKRWILLIEPARILREGFRAFIESEPGHYVTEAASRAEALAALERRSIDVAVLNMDLPETNAPDFSAQLRRLRPQTRIVGYDFGMLETRAIAFMREGCSGCLVGDFSAQDILAAVRSSEGSGLYLNADSAGLVVDHYLRYSGSGRGASTLAMLNRRERQLLRLLSEGRSARDIAENLDIGLSTVFEYRRRVMVKLGVDSTADLTKYAVQEGLTSAY